MDDLNILKAQCGLDNRETICNTLIRLTVHGGLKLNDSQLSFIEKNKPEFRDRDLNSAQPGELFVYECLFGRGLGKLGRVYIHFFVDIFTGYAFGILSQRRNLAGGLDFLTSGIMPVYRANNHLIHTILHSSPHPAKAVKDIHEFNLLETDETFSRLGLQWQLTQRKFGVIEKFEKSLITNKFLESLPKNPESLAALKPLFDQYIVKYNASSRLFSRQELPQEH